MLSKEQVSAIGLLSDTILYPEAVALIRQLVRDEECDPLPTSQVTGLLNVAASATYNQLYTFVVHQRDRNWPASKSDIPKFYIALEKYLTTMQKKRLKDEFHLLTEGLNTKDAKDESDDLMAQLARNFIQHLVAENGLFVAAQGDAKARARTNRSR
jgi:hypothetical protein